MTRTRAALLVAVLLVAGCGDGDDGSGERLAVFSAFPAELAAVLEHTDVRETITVDEHVFRRGTLAGRPVVVAMTGIGLVNAATTTRIALDNFSIRGVVVAGVAGSNLRIADVTAAATWELTGSGEVFATDPRWLARAQRLAGRGVVLERCAEVPSAAAEPVCLAHQPALFTGGAGHSDDPFNGAFQCIFGRDDVFGCDVTDGTTRAITAQLGTATHEEVQVVDMESAAIAREAAARGLPFIVFRAVSDGAGDPLDLPGFPNQFFAYYRLAAHNAAAVAAAFIAAE